MKPEYSAPEEEPYILRQCPDCRRYVHMPSLSMQKCEHCGLITDFTHFTTPEQKLWHFIKASARSSGALVNRYVVIPSFSLIGIGKISRVSLIVALPILLFWLIVFNTIDTSAWKVQHPEAPVNSSSVEDFLDY